MSPIRFFTAVALSAAVVVPTAALAQNAPPPGPPNGPHAVSAPAGQHGHHRHNRFMHALGSLNLSDAQRAQIRDTIRQTRQSNQSADPQTRRANVRAMRQQVEAILTPAQRAQFHAALQRHHHGAPNAPAPAGPGPEGANPGR